MNINKKMAPLCAILLLTMFFPLTTLPANAATSEKSTFAYIGAMPNPVGVGQAVLLHVGIPDALRTYKQ